MKLCLMISIAIAAVLIVLAWISHRSVPEVGGYVIPLLALEWFFYLLAKTQGPSSGNPE